ncbi:hypothetical protein ANPL_00020 [Anaplasma platys]|uniref:Uncharacterized protein n=1 Tax=Anaplasma platys TaxID=949 RepID=A0A858PX24_9RICK|nr:hypothetical protein ANPL_00020 [Anaplasma platys]
MWSVVAPSTTRLSGSRRACYLPLYTGEEGIIFYSRCGLAFLNSQPMTTRYKTHYPTAKSLEFWCPIRLLA